VLSFALEVADRLLVIDGGRFIHEDARANVDTAKISRYLSV
jgi:urea transport system ATP-binding protein